MKKREPQSIDCACYSPKSLVEANVAAANGREWKGMGMSEAKRSEASLCAFLIEQWGGE